MIAIFFPFAVAALAYIAWRYFNNDDDYNSPIVGTYDGITYYDPTKIPTDVIYYPEDNIPEELRPQNAILPYSSVFGCPPGYDTKSRYDNSNTTYPGVPGLPNRSIYCQKQGEKYYDPFHIPTSNSQYGPVYTIPGYSQESKQFQDFFTRYMVLNNVGFGTLQGPYGGLGPLPPFNSPPTKIGNTDPITMV